MQPTTTPGPAPGSGRLFASRRGEGELVDVRPGSTRDDVLACRRMNLMKLKGLCMLTENQLDEWVRFNSREAQGMIVEFVWRLVAASCPKRERRFPLSDSIGQHGPDGILEVGPPFEPFIPESRTYWEIGTNLRAGDRATSVYKDRTDAVSDSVRRETTFIFVTPLSGRRDWEYTWKEDAQLDWLKRREKGEWKDVRIIDGTKLIDWVHQFPAVELWLVHKTRGITPGQIEIPAQHWSEVSSIGEPPPLTPDLFLANRDEAKAKLKELFDGTTTMQLKMTTHYPYQVIDFVSAYLASLDDESRADATGRCLIVYGLTV